jgi:hemin uptake protein HemP
MMSTPEHPPATPVPSKPVSADAAPGTAPPIDSALLFRGATELPIDHHGVRYRLRQTALGKLILTK